MVETSNTPLSGALTVTPKVFSDARGFFFESYRKSSYTGLGEFVQDNVSKSTQHVLRGLHLQTDPNSQAKLVQVLVGEIFDVAVDLRTGSQTYGQWHGEKLSETNHKQFFIPSGFAHGFLVLSEVAVFLYKCSNYYHPISEVTIAWDDPDIGIQWPCKNPILSSKDTAGISFRQFNESYGFPNAERRHRPGHRI